ncbi:AsmA family protein [Roseovarius amoyensis]|uniref:AsmA family protein n=1 Tax=Roseovarius amoyensis TaxID=2211448 RepID=UPI000DBE9D9F|nr:AsmA family protein [Roseovarius amoyensis]
MRWIFRLIGLLLIVAVVAVGSLLLMPGDRIAKVAAQQISRLTGREVTMQGDTRVSFWPVLGVATGPVSVANAEWGQGGSMFTAESLKIGVEPQVLWGGDIRITGLEATDPVINLERAADGRVNWELGVEGVAPSGQAAPDAAPAQSEALALTLDRALITNASFRYTDHGTGKLTEMTGMDFDLRWPEYRGRASFDITLRPAGEPVRITGHLDRLDAFIDGAVSDVDVDVSAKAGEVHFAGRASASAAAEGQLTADLSDTAAFLTGLGLPAPEIPPGLGRSIAAQAQLTLVDGAQLALRDMVLSLDRGNRITGAADVALGGDRPQVNAQLDAGALDLSGLSGGDDAAAGQGGGSGGGAAPAGWSKTPIDASALAQADGQVAFSADSIDLGDLKIGKIRSLATLDRSRLVFELREVRGYEALITGNFVINNRSGLSVGGDLKAEGLDVETFLTDAADVTRLTGTAEGHVSFLGVGGTQQAIMSSLSGEGSFKAADGVIKGFDLDKLMRRGNLTGGTTIFDEMSATFRMNGGVVANNDLVMKLPLARAEGKGTIDLGQRSIDYMFIPVLLEGENSSGLAIPVRIRGSWADPSIKPDLEKAIDLNFAEEKEELKQQAEEEVRRAIEDELGVEVEEGESVEDALEDAVEEKLKDEVERGLKRLFR